MKPIVFSLYSNPILDQMIDKKTDYARGEIILREFPDGESYVRMKTDVNQRHVILIATLNRPNSKILSLLFSAKAAKEQGAKSVGLIAPYLAYMRQDKKFHSGEVVTSCEFARIISHYLDWMVTIDPHLHRYKSLDEIYTIPSTVLHAEHEIAVWIKNNVEQPIMIGPDRESEQWVAKIASLARAPYLVLEKIRKGDQEVEVSIPRIERYIHHAPIIVDDIISTARTQIETVKHLQALNLKPAICIAIHALFSGDAYQDLLSTNVEKVITCNTVTHPSNGIDVSHSIVDYLLKYMPKLLLSNHEK